nr:MAG: polyprotein [Wufeng shrew picorna-like virus 10]
MFHSTLSTDNLMTTSDNSNVSSFDTSSTTRTPLYYYSTLTGQRVPFHRTYPFCLVESVAPPHPVEGTTLKNRPSLPKLEKRCIATTIPTSRSDLSRYHLYQVGPFGVLQTPSRQAVFINRHGYGQCPKRILLASTNPQDKDCDVSIKFTRCFALPKVQSDNQMTHQNAARTLNSTSSSHGGESHALTSNNQMTHQNAARTLNPISSSSSGESHALTSIPAPPVDTSPAVPSGIGAAFNTAITTINDVAIPAIGTASAVFGAGSSVAGLVSSMINAPAATAFTMGGVGISPSALAVMSDIPSSDHAVKDPIDNTDIVIIDPAPSDLDQPLNADFIRHYEGFRPDINSYLNWVTLISQQLSTTAVKIELTNQQAITNWPILALYNRYRLAYELMIEARTTMFQTCPVQVIVASYRDNSNLVGINPKYIDNQTVFEARDAQNHRVILPNYSNMQVSPSNGNGRNCDVWFRTLIDPPSNSHVTVRIRPIILDAQFAHDFRLNYTQGDDEKTVGKISQRPLTPRVPFAPVKNPLAYVIGLPNMTEVSLLVTHETPFTNTTLQLPASDLPLFYSGLVSCAQHMRFGYNVRLVWFGPSMTIGKFRIGVSGIASDAEPPHSRYFYWDVSTDNVFTIHIPWSYRSAYMDLNSARSISPHLHISTEGINIMGTPASTGRLLVQYSLSEDTSMFNLRLPDVIVDSDWRTQSDSEKTVQELTTKRMIRKYTEPIKTTINGHGGSVLFLDYKHFSSERPITYKDLIALKAIFADVQYSSFSFKTPIKMLPCGPAFMKWPLVAQTPTSGFTCHPLAILAMFFFYWTGELDYEIQFVSNTSASGKIMITHVPVIGHVPAFHELKGAHGTRLDLSLGRAVEITALQRGTWTFKTSPTANMWNDTMQNSVVATDDQYSTHGYLWMTPATYVNVTNAGASGAAQFTVAGCAGKDFQFYVPRGPKTRSNFAALPKTQSDDELTIQKPTAIVRCFTNRKLFTGETQHSPVVPTNALSILNCSPHEADSWAWYLKNHYSLNRHHPEYFTIHSDDTPSIDDMTETLVDLLSSASRITPTPRHTVEEVKKWLKATKFSYLSAIQKQIDSLMTTILNDPNADIPYPNRSNWRSKTEVTESWSEFIKTQGWRDIKSFGYLKTENLEEVLFICSRYVNSRNTDVMNRLIRQFKPMSACYREIAAHILNVRNMYKLFFSINVNHDPDKLDVRMFNAYFLKWGMDTEKFFSDFRLDGIVQMTDDYTSQFGNEEWSFPRYHAGDYQTPSTSNLDPTTPAFHPTPSAPPPADSTEEVKKSWLTSLLDTINPMTTINKAATDVSKAANDLSAAAGTINNKVSSISEKSVFKTFTDSLWERIKQFYPAASVLSIMISAIQIYRSTDITSRVLHITQLLLNSGLIPILCSYVVTLFQKMFSLFEASKNSTEEVSVIEYDHDTHKFKTIKVAASDPRAKLLPTTQGPNNPDFYENRHTTHMIKGWGYLFFCAFSAICFGSSFNEKDVDGNYVSFVQSFGSKVPYMIGLYHLTRFGTEFLPYVVTYFERVVQWWRGTIPKSVEYAFSGEEKKKQISAWLNKVEYVLTPEHDAVLRTSVDARNNVTILLHQGMALRSFCLQAEVPNGVAAPIHSAITLLRKVQERASKYSTFTQARIAPYTVMFSGEPNIGKSTFLPSVCYGLLQSRGIASTNPIYSYSFDKDHMDGYCEQPAVIVDELAPQVEDYGPYSMFLNAINDNCWIPPQASLDDKGRPFTSQFFVGASNSLHPCVPLHDPDAWHRRFVKIVCRRKTISVTDGTKTRSEPMPYDDNFDHLSFSRVASINNVELPGVDYFSNVSYKQLMVHLKTDAANHFDSQVKVMNLRMKHLTAYLEATGTDPKSMNMSIPYYLPGKSLTEMRRQYDEDKKYCDFTDAVWLPYFPSHCFSSTDENIRTFVCHAGNEYAMKQLPFFNAKEFKGLIHTLQPWHLWALYCILKSAVGTGNRPTLQDWIEMIMTFGSNTKLNRLRFELDRILENDMLEYKLSCDANTRIYDNLLKQYRLDNPSLWPYSTVPEVDSKLHSFFKEYCSVKAISRLFDWIKSSAKSFWKKHSTLLKVAGLLAVLAGTGGIIYMLYHASNEPQPTQGPTTTYGAATRNKPNPKLTAPAMPIVQSPVDPNVINRIQYNIFHFRVGQKDPLSEPAKNFTCLGLGRRCFLINRHVMDEVLKLNPKKMWLKGVWERQFPMQHVVFHPIGDADCVIMQVKTSSVPDIPSIIGYFLASHELAKYLNPDVDIYYRDAKTAISGEDLPPIAPISVKAELVTVTTFSTDGDVKKIYMVPVSMRYSFSKAGACGSPVVASSVTTNAALFGIHAYGTGSQGSAIVLTREVISSIYDNIDHENAVSPTMVDFLERTNQKIVPQGDNIIVGLMCKEDTPYQPRTTDLRKTALHDAVFKVMKQPAVLDVHDPRNDGVDPFVRASAKYAKPGLRDHIDDDIAEIFTEGLSAELEALNYDRPRILSVEEAINGCPYSEYMTRINMESSAGYPYVVWKNSLRINSTGKAWLFNTAGMKPDGSTIYSMTPLLANMYHARLEAAKNGERVDSVWMDCLKDELRPLEKVKKTRIINVGPLDYTILTRQYTLPFADLLMTNMSRLPFKCGINAQGYDWSVLAAQLQRVNSEGRDCDFSQFDSSHCSQVLSIANDVIRRWVMKGVNDMCCTNGFYDLVEIRKHKNVLNCILDEIVQKDNLARNVRYRLYSGLNSGHPLTTTVNNIVQTFYFFWCWCVLARRNGEQRLISWYQFRHHVELCTYGDDGLQFSSPEYPWYNNNACSEILSTINVTLTTSDKNETESHLKPLTELQFISRGFRPYNNSTSLFTAPLKRESINELVNWWRKGRDEMEALHENLNDALRFMFAYGKCDFEDFHSKITVALRNHCIRLPRPLITFSELDFEYRVEVGLA